MKRICSALLFLACSTANAQFVTGQILTAAQLNAAFANVLSLSGGTLTGPLTVQGGTTLANLTVNGTFTVPGGFSPSGLSPQAANTDLANVTGSSASPAAVPIPSCSTANSAIKYTSGTGWSCGTTFALTSGTLAQFAATTSAQLAGVVSDESGSGSLLFGTSPTIATPAITGGSISGTPISGSTGAFTTLAASSTVSGAGFTTLLSPYLTSATAASTYATIAQATTALAATGGSINGVTSGITTPAASKVTTLQATSTITPSTTAGIVGTVLADNAQAGSDGEYLTTLGTATSIASGTTSAPGSISLTAGDWDVQATILLTPAGTTIVAQVIAGVSTVNNSFGALGTYTQTSNVSGSAGAAPVTPTPVVRVNISTTATYFAVVNANFSTSTCTATVFMRARRVR